MRKHIDKLSLAWAAGIMDADGSITILGCSKKRLRNGNCVRYPELRLWLSNYDPKMVKKFKQMFGGTYYTYSREDRRKPIQCWNAACKIAKKALLLMEPYLVTKREQAKLALKFREEKENRKKYFFTPKEWEKRCEYWIQESRKLKV